jgi:hypothetical protein
MRALKAESAFPRARLGITGNRERQLVFVSIPRTDQMDGLDVGGGAKREGKLNCGTRHFVVRE